MISEAEIQLALDDVVEIEGGYIDHPADRGGPTKFGITKPTLARYLGVNISEVTNDMIARLDVSTVRDLYRKLFIMDRDYHYIDDPWVFGFIVDMGVNHHERTAARIVQKAAAPLLTIDGIFGPKTINVVNRLTETEPSRSRFMVEAVAHRLDHYANEVKRDPTQAAFIRGWVRRAMDFLRSNPSQVGQSRATS